MEGFMTVSHCFRIVLATALVAAFGAPALAQFYADDFERADGAATGWSSAEGDWKIEGGRLIGGPPPAGEQHIFAGDPAVALPNDFTASVDWEFLAPADNEPPVGRHAGIMFCAQSLVGRGANSCYNLWWIDRAGDRGFNLVRRDAGGSVLLQVGPGAAAPDAQPPANVVIEVKGPSIRVFGDGALLIDVVDSTYRGGHLGMWTWNGAGQTVAYDNVRVDAFVAIDDFSRPGIPGWITHAGNWRLENDQLAVGPTGGEAQVFADGFELPTDYSVTYTQNVTSGGSNADIGPHFSCFLNFNQPGRRWDAETSGYQVHWINRASDFGLNLLRWDGGGIVSLQAGTGELFAAPPAEIRVEVEGEMIRVFGDDVMAFEVADSTYRGGLLGFWAWEFATEVEFDDVSVVDGDGVEVFADDFSPRPPPIGDWTVHAGTWGIAGDKLVAGPAPGGGAPGEQQAFVGLPPTVLPDDYTVSFDWNFIAPADNAPPVGRHAGAYFGFNKPGVRWDADTSGYQLWWIDRASDRGLTLAHWNQGGGFTTLNPPGGTGELFAQPPAHIEIQVEGDMIRVWGDGVLAIEVADTSSRGGNFGFWTWDGAGQHVEFDNLSIVGTPVVLDPCITVSPGPFVAGVDTVSFDASCTFGEVETYTWDYGDGTVEDGPPQIDHV